MVVEKVLLKQNHKEAKEIALALELFTKGSFNIFAKQTNVEIDNRLVCYDIMELGEQLMPAGMLVILDNIYNRISSNRKKGIKTYIYIDEIYLLFKYQNTSTFISELWKRIRKYGGCATGISQNVEEILKCSDRIKTITGNPTTLYRGPYGEYNDTVVKAAIAATDNKSFFISS